MCARRVREPSDARAVLVQVPGLLALPAVQSDCRLPDELPSCSAGPYIWSGAHTRKLPGAACLPGKPGRRTRRRRWARAPGAQARTKGGGPAPAGPSPDIQAPGGARPPLSLDFLK